MSKRIFGIVGVLAIVLGTAGLALAQDTPGAATTTTTVTKTNPDGTQDTSITKTTQNPDGTYSIIEYPVGKEVVVNLTPATTLTGATGTATVIRQGSISTINLNLSGLPADASSYNLYAVDPSGGVSMIGPVTVANGIATQTFTTPMNRFMLFLSPESGLTSYDPNTNVIFRSAVPSGFAVVPYRESRPKTDAIHAKATTTVGPTAGYNTPLLNVPTFKRNAWNRVRVNFAGPLEGSTATILIRPRTDHTTEIHANFHHLKRTDVAERTRLVLWAVSPDNTYVKLGQIVDTGDRNKADIHTETTLRDFGLFVTAESGSEMMQPAGPAVITVMK